MMLDGAPLLDHHCHGLIRGELSADTVDALLSEGGAAAPGTTNFDTPIGLAVRRHCAPVLGLPAHAPAADYLARRAELGATDVTTRLLRASGTAAFLVDLVVDVAGVVSPVAGFSNMFTFVMVATVTLNLAVARRRERIVESTQVLTS